MPARLASESTRVHGPATAVTKRTVIQRPTGERPIRSREESQESSIRGCVQRHLGGVQPRTLQLATPLGRERWLLRDHWGLHRSRKRSAALVPWSAKLYGSSQGTPHLIVRRFRHIVIPLASLSSSATQVRCKSAMSYCRRAGAVGHWAMPMLPFGSRWRVGA